jgi:hypothetical protein
MQRLFLMLALLAPTLADAGGKPNLLDDLKSRFETTPAQAKTKLACKGAWKESTQAAPDGRNVTSLTCGDGHPELMIRDGAVFAYGMALADQVKDRAAKATLDGAKADVVAGKCKVLRDQGQLVVYDCPDGFAVIFLDNWNSKNDTHTVSVIFGRSNVLLAMLGASK